MFETIGTPKGKLNVNCTYDTDLSTRAEQNAGANWIIKAGEKTLSQGTNTIPAGTYIVTASNYADVAKALEANGSWGDAFYKGSQPEVVVEKGANTDISIACGKAQNARMKVNFNNLLGSFTEVKLVADPTTRNLEFNTGENAGKLAYFAASTTVKCKLSYKFSGSFTEKHFDFALAGAATENVITVTTNDNGTISINLSNITYDNEFGAGNGQTITIDAVSGEEVQ